MNIIAKSNQNDALKADFNKTNKPVFNCCTLFDRNYLYKGIALHNSLSKHCDSFRMWILCMDEKTFEILQKMNLNSVELINLSEIEDEKLLSVKKSRNAGEYSWTCKSFLLLFIFEKFENLKTLSYLDADLYFFDSPFKIYEEFGDNSIMLTPHRFIKKRMDWEKIRGRYNAGVIISKNDKIAKKCFNWWKEECLNWCFQRYEKGKMGDQLYLDQWDERFSGIYDIKNTGVNLGPWNISRYEIKTKGKKVVIGKYPLILFHFHALKIFSSSSFEPAAGYNISKKNINLIYNPYYAELRKIISDVSIIDKNFSFGFSDQINFYQKIKNFISRIIQ